MSRAQRGGVGAAVAAAIVVRVVQLGVKWDQPLLLNDSLWYSAQAVVIARGDGFADPFAGGPSAEHGPLTPIVLAAVSWIDDPLPWQRAVMTVVGIAGVVGIVVLTARVAGWTAAVAAGWIAALYPMLWINDGVVMSESLAILLVVVVMWLGLDVVDGRPGWWRAGLLGVAIGLAGLARSELVLLLPILLVVVAVGRRRRLGAALGSMVGGTVLVLAPWVGPNLVRFDEPVILTTNDGTTLLGANCPDTYGGSSIGGWSLSCVLAASGPEGEDPSTRSDRQRRLALTYAREHPERLPLVAAARVGRLVDVVGVSDMVHGDDGEERPVWATWVGIVCFWLLAIAAVVGFVRLRPPARWVLLAPVISVVITTVAFYGAHRIRAPAEPVIVVAAATAVGAAVSRWWARRATS